MLEAEVPNLTVLMKVRPCCANLSPDQSQHARGHWESPCTVSSGVDDRDAHEDAVTTPCFYGLDYAFAYACFHDTSTSMIHGYVVSRSM
jgi:hypothetical protein